MNSICCVSIKKTTNARLKCDIMKKKPDTCLNSVYCGSIKKTESTYLNSLSCDIIKKQPVHV